MEGEEKTIHYLEMIKGASEQMVERIKDPADQVTPDEVRSEIELIEREIRYLRNHLFTLDGQLEGNHL